MSRFCGEKQSERILRAAQHWRDSCLVAGRSVFTDQGLWRAEPLEELFQHFVSKPDLGEGKFLAKFQEQLAPTSPSAKMLAAEIIWVMYLCPSSLTPNKKVKTITEVWSWSGSELPESEWLRGDLLGGIGSAGPGFNQNQWREIAFVVNMARGLLALEAPSREALLKDPWKFAEWLQKVPEWDRRQFRHMVLFLLFPDQFERIFGGIDRKAIVTTFSGKPRKEIARLDPLEIDRVLTEIRADLEKEHGTNLLDFYISPIKEKWSAEPLSDAAEELSAEHVLEAILEIDRDGVPPDAQSRTYDLIHNGKRYPPKLVLSLAVKKATGEELDRGTFAGGEGTAAFKLLAALGFDIQPKGAIRELLQRFLRQAEEATDLAVQTYSKSYRGLTVRVSFGTGNFARVPWVAFLAEGQTVQDGIYPVLLLYKEQRQLLLCYGVSETNPPAIRWGGDASGPTVREWFREHLGTAPPRYNESIVAAAYSLDDPMPFDDISTRLDAMIDAYRARLGASEGSTSSVQIDPGPSLEIRADLATAVTEFDVAIKQAHLDFGPAHTKLVRAFVASILAKPFVILTGLSGSGKTQIAMQFGKWLGSGRSLVTAVRPDWTGAEALFGFEDGLKPADAFGSAAWAVPLPLEFMIRAARDTRHPYLLLLDEMNLAHVERYFADVLSGMETGEDCLPNLWKGTDGAWRVRQGEPSRVPFPRNLWVVGTVNIDETTYMFSPKVLDRANTFEFRVPTDALNALAHKPIDCSPGDQALVRGLLAVAGEDAWHQENPADFQEEISGHLQHVHRILSRHNLEFGHRVYYEALRFAAIAAEVGISSAAEVLDRIVLQKVLPRLHGSRRKLEPVLLALISFCRDLPDTVASDEQLQSLDVDTVTIPVLPESFEKLARMLRTLRANQFVSFAE